MSEHKHTKYVKTKHLSKSAQLAADIASGKVKFLHTSVLVGKNAKGELMRTPRGKGATAHKVKASV